MMGLPSTQDEDRPNMAVRLVQGAIIAVNHYADPRVCFMAGLWQVSRTQSANSAAGACRGIPLARPAQPEVTAENQ